MIVLQSHSQASTPRFLMGWSGNETMTGSATADSASQLDHIPSVVSLLASNNSRSIDQNKKLVETTEGIIMVLS